MNEKNEDDKDIILTQLIDEFFERKYAGEEPTIDEYIERYPEYGDEIKSELEEELSWLLKFNELKKSPKIVSTEEELREGWKKVLNKIIWEPDPKSKSIWRLLEEIKVNVSQLVLQVIVPDFLQPSITHRRFAAPMRLRDGSSPEIEEIEVPIKEIDGSLKITFCPSSTKGCIEIKVQPEIKEANLTKRPIPIILRDPERDMMEEQRSIYSKERVTFTVPTGKKHSIAIRWKSKTYEIPVRL
jgi:hypothetical protein